MSKAVYVGVGGKARRVSKMYVGVGGKARRIKYGYVGVDGKARQFYSAGELSKPAFSASMSANSSEYGAASVGGYALFAGGSNNPILWNTGKNSVTTKVMSVNESLTVGAPTSLRSARYGLKSATTNSYACFLYGARSEGSSNHYNDNTCDVYNASLTRQNINPPVSKNTSSSYSSNEVAQGVGDRIYVRVGNSVYMADKSLTWRKLEDIRERTTSYYDHVQDEPRIGSVGDYMIIAGGLLYHFNSSGSDSYDHSRLVDAYDAGGTRRNAGNLPNGAGSVSGISSAKNRMLIIGYQYGGSIGYSIPENVQAINKSLTATDRGNILPDDIQYMATASVDDITIAMGGSVDGRYSLSYQGRNQTARAYMFDEAITCSRAPDASDGRKGHLAANAGANMVFGGGKYSKSANGMTSNYLTSNMDVYCYK